MGRAGGKTRGCSDPFARGMGLHVKKKLKWAEGPAGRTRENFRSGPHSGKIGGKSG